MNKFGLAVFVLLTSIFAQAQTTLTDDGTKDTIHYSGKNYFDYTIPSAPALPYISLAARGGDGGEAKTTQTGVNSCRADGGEGAFVEAVFKIGSGAGELKPGSTIRFIPGQQGDTDHSQAELGLGLSRAGGGGGTGILYKEAGSSTWEVLVAAGGGGGAYVGMFASLCTDNSKGQGGRDTEKGGRGKGDSDRGASGSNGRGARGGGPFHDWSGGGGGAFSNGIAANCMEGLAGDTTGGDGGCGSGNVKAGGWGFGGGGSADDAGGGGGGYSGGGGGGGTGGGGGGGSYFASTAQFGSKSKGGSTGNPKNGHTVYYFLNIQGVMSCKSGTKTLNIDHDTGANLTVNDLNDSNNLLPGQSFKLTQTFFDDSHIGTHTVYLLKLDNGGNILDFCSRQVQINDVTTTLNDNGNLQTSEGSYNNSNPSAVYKIPANTTMNELTISSRGADGGWVKIGGIKGNKLCGTCRSSAGEGATISATFNLGTGASQLPKGAYIRFISGEKGENVKQDNQCAAIEGAGGGGGTAVQYREPGDDEWNILVVAGGGGGAYQGKTFGACVDGQKGKPAETTVNGSNGGRSNGGGLGRNGEGGGSTESATGGGGAFSGAASIQSPFNGATGGRKGMENGGNGGDGDGNAERGGWGFGGGGSGWEGGGGGGGYSGGGGGGNYGGGGGGGSYVYDIATSSTKTKNGTTQDPINGYSTYVFGQNCSSAPIANCKSATLYLNSSGTATLSTTDVDGGSYDDCNVLSLSVSKTSFNCNNLGDNTVVLTASDANSSSTCNATVTVEDTLAPTAVCEDITVALNSNCKATIQASQLNGGSLDNCGLLEYTMQYTVCNPLCIDYIFATSLTLTGEQTKTVKLNVQDTVSGKFSYCNARITVVDQTPPTAVCNDLTIALNGSCSAIIDINTITAGSSDNCGIASWTMSYTLCNPLCLDYLFATSITLNGVTSKNVSVKITDNNGLVSTCTATLTTEDLTPPTAICKTDTVSVYLDGNGDRTFSPSELFAGATDNCGGGSPVSVSPASFDCSDVGYNSVVLTVRDDAGNQGTCTATVEVLDTVPPVVACQDVTLYLDASGETPSIIPIATNIVILSESDNCGIANQGVTGPSRYNCSQIGANIQTIVTNDVNGNKSRCTFTFTVADTIKPVAVCKDTTISLDAKGTATLNPASIDGGSTDNCDVSFSASTTTFFCGNVGANTVTLTVTDVAGNTDNCTATVTVLDNSPPVARCKTVIVPLNAAGTATITSSTVNNNSIDFCGISSMSVSPSGFNCANVGINGVTLTVTDNYGNTSACLALVTVQDITPPTALCKAHTVKLNASGIGTLTPANINNGSSDACGIASLKASQTTFNCSHVGVNNVTLTVLDINGNISSCISKVTVEDNVNPIASCKNATVQLDSTGNASITINDIDDGSFDACGIASLSLSDLTFDCNDLVNSGGSGTISGVPEVTLTVTDSSGNSSTCIGQVQVFDYIAPIITCPADVTITADANCEATYSAPMATAWDNCELTITSNPVLPATFSGQGEHIIEYIATDESGNADTCTQTITVISPVIADAGANLDVVINTGSGPDPQSCVNLNGSATGGQGIYTYNWTPATGLADPADPKTQTCPTASTWYYLIALDTGGCFGIDSTLVTVTDIASDSLPGVGNNTNRLYVCYTATCTEDIVVARANCSSPQSLCYALNNGATLGKCNCKTAQPDDITSSRQIRAYPNPFSNKVNIEFTLDEDEKASLEILSMNGTVVKVLFDGIAKKGDLNKFQFDGSQQASGVYFYRLQTKGGYEYDKLILLK